ncbi:MAG: hypothetical protein ACJAZ8_001956 [Planctomycetota bacterium]|jgi:hypothetical protein
MGKRRGHFLGNGSNTHKNPKIRPFSSLTLGLGVAFFLLRE